MHDNRDSIQRLKTAEGHLRGIQKMLEEDAYCIDIIQQIQAVQAALHKVNSQILQQHLNSCVITAIKSNDEDERERVMKEIISVFDASKNPNNHDPRDQEKKNMNTVTYHIPNISCHHCAHTIKMELSELEGVKGVDVAVEAKTTTIEYDHPATEEQLKSLLAEINYPVDE